MRFDYDKVASLYDRHRRGGGPYLETLVDLAKRSDAQTAVEFGAGTGNNTGAFVAAHPCKLVAVERARGMLFKGLEKALPVCWLQGDATHVPLAGGCADFALSVYMLHHLRALEPLFRECARILRGGCTAHVTTTHDFIERHPAARFFPSFTTIDKARFQTEGQIVSDMRAAGFENIESQVCRAAPAPVDSAYVERVAGKFISTFDLLPHEEFEAGVEQMRAEVERKGQLEDPVCWESVVVWGFHGKQRSM